MQSRRDTRVAPRFASALLTCVMTLLLSPSEAIAQVNAPPAALRVADSDAGRLDLLLLTESTGKRVRLGVGVHTLRRRVVLEWYGAESISAEPIGELTEESTSYYPTASCRSAVDSKSVYVAGKDKVTGHAVIEKFTFEAPVFAHLTTGETVLLVQPPEREILPVDSTLQNATDICAMSKLVEGSAVDRLIFFEYETRTAFVLDPVSGQKSQVLDPVKTLAFRSCNTRRHSAYGNVVLFRRQPFFEPSALQQADDTAFFVAYDSDLDGVFNGEFTIQWDVLSSHVLYTTPEFLDFE